MQCLLVLAEDRYTQPMGYPAMTFTVLIVLNDAPLQAFEYKCRAVFQDFDDLPEVLKITHLGADLVP